MEEEIWKTVIYNGEVYDTIEVSNIGRMRNSKNGRIYKLSLNKTGYYQKTISLGSRTKNKTFYVHKAVAEAFIDNPDNKPIVNHIDGDKLNNNIDNLEWVTSKENVNHALSNGLMGRARGEKICFSKLTEEDVRYIRNHYIPYDELYGAKALAKKFNIDTYTVNNVYYRKTWKHVV